MENTVFRKIGKYILNIKIMCNTSDNTVTILIYFLAVFKNTLRVCEVCIFLEPIFQPLGFRRAGVAMRGRARRAEVCLQPAALVYPAPEPAAGLLQAQETRPPFFFTPHLLKLPSFNHTQSLRHLVSASPPASASKRKLSYRHQSSLGQEGS